MVFSAFAAVGCGGGETSTTQGLACGGTFTPCGGEISGKWSVASFCGTPDGLKSCPTAAAKYTAVSWVGSLEFTPDSTIGRGITGATLQTYNASLDSELSIPSACISKTCSTMTAVEHATCAEQPADLGSTCVCKVHTDSLSTGPQTDYYQLSGNNVIIGLQNWVYCVKGDTLTLSTSLTDGAGVKRLTLKRGAL